MKIRRVRVNNSKKSLDIESTNGPLSLPFSKLDVAPTPDNKIKEAYVDKELGEKAITYVLESGEEDSVHIDEFLEYNRDPKYLSNMKLYQLTLIANELLEKSPLPKREVARKLKTSPSQLYRLLDTANYSKTIDQMIKLISALDYEIEFRIRETGSAISNSLTARFPYLSKEQVKEHPRSSTFIPLGHAPHQKAA